ncbi:MAG: FG-GAP-like repeat-containing protein [Blastocatellia bacterium]
MYVYDVNGDGLNDVVTSSAHKTGIWWFEQKKGTSDHPEFIQHEIDSSISQTHSLMLADINGDGKLDIVTGKRYWAHGPTGDVNPDAPAVVVWFDCNAKKAK